MEHKAKFIAKYNYPKEYYTELVYLYRGMEYTVINYWFNTVETLKQQHEREQARIDTIIDARSVDRDPNVPTVQEAMDALFKYWETGEIDEEVFS